MLAHGAKIFHLHLFGQGVQLGNILFLQITNVNLLAIGLLKRCKVFTMLLYISRQSGWNITTTLTATATLVRTTLGILICRSRHGVWVC